MPHVPLGNSFGSGNYGSIVCMKCRLAKFRILLIKDASIVVTVCAGCNDPSFVFKVDDRVDGDEVAKEFEGRRDIAELVDNLDKLRQTDRDTKLIRAMRAIAGKTIALDADVFAKKFLEAWEIPLWEPPPVKKN